MKVQVIKGFAVRDINGRMVFPNIGDIIDISIADAKSLEKRGSVIVLDVEEPPPPTPKPTKKKVI
jgi:hypothetical protein